MVGRFVGCSVRFSCGCVVSCVSRVVVRVICLVEVLGISLICVIFFEVLLFRIVGIIWFSCLCY